MQIAFFRTAIRTFKQNNLKNLTSKIADPLALSHLIKYVYNNGSDEVIRRGKKIHSSGFVELVEHDQLMNSVVFRVKDDS